VESNPNLSEEQRQAALVAISRETEKAVSDVMGPNVYKSYLRVAGQWIPGLSEANMQVVVEQP
jgi:hypothetical protein